MYRQYEDPYQLEEYLAELTARSKENPEDIELACEIAEVKDRINFAWQDEYAE